jgi:hypothetical protein
MEAALKATSETTEEKTMNDSTPHIPLFSQLENTVTVVPEKDGLTFWWSRKEIGFGSLYLGVENGKFVVDTECMGAEICGEIITQAITEALARQRKEEGRP